MRVRPIPRLESIAGPLKKITFHGDAVICIHIVLQSGVVIREVLSKKDKGRKRWKVGEKVRAKKRGKKNNDSGVKTKYST